MIPANASARKGPEGKYPLHYLVWHNRHRELEKEVRAGQVGASSGTMAPHARAAWGGGAAPPVPPPRLVCSASLFAAAAFVLVDLKRVMAAAPACFSGSRTGGPHVFQALRDWCGGTLCSSSLGLEGTTGRGCRFCPCSMWWESPPHSISARHPRVNVQR